jgi:non-ribosomal peptide synthetase component F
MAMDLAGLPDERAASSPRGPCLASGRRELDNASFAAEVRRLSSALAEIGVGRGDVVAVVLPNGVDLVSIMFAAWRLGAVLTPVNPALTRPETQYQVADSGARLVVVDESSSSKVERGVARVCAVDELMRRDVGIAVRPRSTEPDGLALMIYTGGTTGRPKGVMLDHANLLATAAMIVNWFEMTAADRCLLVLPLFHVNGIMVSVVSPLVAGGCTVIAPRFDPTTFWDLVERCPAHVLFRRADDLRDAGGAADRRPARHRVVAVRGLRSRADACRGDCRVRGSLRRSHPRGVRPVRRDGGDDGKSFARLAQARDGGSAVARAGGPRRGQGRRAVAVRTGRRGDGAGPERDARISRQARGNGRDAAWRLAAQRRSGPV